MASFTLVPAIGLRGTARAPAAPRRPAACQARAPPLPSPRPWRPAPAACSGRPAPPVPCATGTATAAPASVPATGPKEEPPLAATQLVDELLDRIEGTDAGQAASKEERERIDGIIEELEAVGARQQPRPIDNPLLFGNYVVAYVSGGKRQRGNPAGGRFRGKVGRALFRTEGLYQNVLRPDLVVNKVVFKLLGFIPGLVALKGTIELLKDVGDGTDTVRAHFDRPRVRLPTGLVGYGPTSSVVLATTYLDDRVRLGRGGFGSLFVFTRGGRADTEEGQVDLSMWEAGAAGTGRWLGLGLAAAMATGAWAALRAPGLLPRVLGGIMAAATVLLTYTLGRGGIEREAKVEGGKIVSPDMDAAGMAEGPRGPRLARKFKRKETGPGGSYTMYRFS